MELGFWGLLINHRLCWLLPFLKFLLWYHDHHPLFIILLPFWIMSQWQSSPSWDSYTIRTARQPLISQSPRSDPESQGFQTPATFFALITIQMSCCDKTGGASMLLKNWNISKWPTTNHHHLIKFLNVHLAHFSEAPQGGSSGLQKPPGHLSLIAHRWHLFQNKACGVKCENENCTMQLTKTN